MKTKIILYCFCAALIFSVCAPAVSAAEPAVLIVGQTAANPGESVVIPITLEKNPGIAALKIKIEYDSSRLKIENQNSVAKGQALGVLNYMGADSATIKNNPFIILWYGSWNDSSTGVILNVTFTVLDSAPAGEAFVSVICEPSDAVNSSGAKIPVSIKNAGMTISGQQSEEPPKTPDTTPPAANFSRPENEITYISPQPQGSKEEAKKEEVKKEEVKEVKKEEPENFLAIFKKLQRNAGNELAFADVAKKEWFFEAVAFVASRGLFIGVGGDMFMPKGTMTRGMFLTVLARLDGADLSEYAVSPYSDSDIKEWYGQAVAWAKSAGIISEGIVAGCEPGTFCPKDDITREQMADIFANYIKFKDLPLKADPKPEFSDIKEASVWARDSIQNMRSLGIINGIGDNLYNPKGIASRAEVAQIFKNLISAISDFNS